MTARRTLVVGLLCAALLASGCLGGPTTGATPAPDDGTPVPSTGHSPTATATTGTPVTGYETHVFDHAGVDGPVVAGGIRYPTDGEYATQYYATTIASDDETDRFNESLLPGAARAFVANTTFENETLVVVQAFPASSHPDYRVESVRRDGGTLRVAINDSSWGGTADITVETVLLRVPGEPPERVEVTTEEGVTFDSEGGITTVAQTPRPTPTDPFAGVSDAKRLADGGDLRVVNEGGDVNGYSVTLVYRHVPACRDETPACGMPNRSITAETAVGKLPPGANRTLADVASYRGTYEVRVGAEVPAENGSRRTIERTFEWSVNESAASATVTITGDDVSFRTGD